MSVIKVLIKKANPEKWYHTHIGEKLNVFEHPITTNGKNHYQYVIDPKFMICIEDCYTNIELREEKLKRIRYVRKKKI